jgi:hypothetical protein
VNEENRKNDESKKKRKMNNLDFNRENPCEDLKSNKNIYDEKNV